MMSVPVTVNSRFEPGLPISLFPTRAANFLPYDVTPDGRFLINTMGNDAMAPVSPIIGTVNWRQPHSK